MEILTKEWIDIIRFEYRCDFVLGYSDMFYSVFDGERAVFDRLAPSHLIVRKLIG